MKTTQEKGEFTKQREEAKQPKSPPAWRSTLTACVQSSRTRPGCVSSARRSLHGLLSSDPSPGLKKSDNVLTHTDRRLPRPAVILLADPHRHPDEAEAGIALINHAAAVVVVLPVDLPVDDGTGNAAVPRCGRERRGGGVSPGARPWPSRRRPTPPHLSGWI